MRTLIRISLLLLVTASTAAARPVEDGTRVGFSLGGRYVPHTHFKNLASASGYPVQSDSPIGPAGLLTFAYAPEPSIEVSLEGGLALDSYTLSASTLRVTSVPLVFSARWMPTGGSLYPYLGGGGGYVLNFISGAPTAQSESHAQEFHLVLGLAYELSPQWLLTFEDRYALASGDVLPIGQINTGGNTLLIGLSFVYAPEKPIAPH